MVDDSGGPDDAAVCLAGSARGFHQLVALHLGCDVSINDCDRERAVVGRSCIQVMESVLR